MAFGKKLEEALKMKNIRPGTLAAMTDINKNTIYSMIKRDTTKIDMSVVQKIATALDMEIDYFLVPDAVEELALNQEKPTNLGGLTVFEQEFLDNYAALNDQNRHILLVIAAALLKDQAKASGSQVSKSET